MINKCLAEVKLKDLHHTCAYLNKLPPELNTMSGANQPENIGYQNINNHISSSLWGE